jgi:hypothetical protein
MVVACFVVGDVPMLAMSLVRSPRCHIGQARKNMRGTKQWVFTFQSSAEIGGLGDQTTFRF